MVCANTTVSSCLAKTQPPSSAVAIFQPFHLTPQQQNSLSQCLNTVRGRYKLAHLICTSDCRLGPWGKMSNKKLAYCYVYLGPMPWNYGRDKVCLIKILTMQSSEAEKLPIVNHLQQENKAVVKHLQLLRV